MSMATRFEPYVRAKFGNRYRKGRSRNGLEFKVCCPFCVRNGLKADKKYKLWINPGKGVYRCWRCNIRGQVEDLFGHIADLGENPFQAEAVSPLTQTDVMPGLMVNLADLDEDHLAFRYMRNRGFDPVALGKFYGIRYCYEGRIFGGGSFRFDTYNTIVFPIWMNQQVVGWQARLLYNPNDLTPAECAGFQFLIDDPF